MKQSKSLEKVRSQLGDTLEFFLIDEEYHSDIVKELDNLTQQMNNEKIQAIREINNRYKEKIHTLQEEYATILKLSK